MNKIDENLEPEAFKIRKEFLFNLFIGIPPEECQQALNWLLTSKNKDGINYTIVMAKLGVLALQYFENAGQNGQKCLKAHKAIYELMPEIKALQIEAGLNAIETYKQMLADSMNCGEYIK